MVPLFNRGGGTASRRGVQTRSSRTVSAGSCDSVGLRRTSQDWPHRVESNCRLLRGANANLTHAWYADCIRRRARRDRWSETRTGCSRRNRRERGLGLSAVLGGSGSLAATPWANGGIAGRLRSGNRPDRGLRRESVPPPKAWLTFYPKDCRNPFTLPVTSIEPA